MTNSGATPPRKHDVFFVGGQLAHNYTEIADRLDEALNRVGKRLRVHGAARVAQWKGLVARVRQAKPREVLEGMVPALQLGEWEHAYDGEMRALVEARHFIVIVEALLDDLSDDELRLLISGHLHAADDKEAAPGRDRQFEFFVAAVASRAGMKVVLAEPDVVVDGKLGLAAKRIRSDRQIEKHLAKAAKQIEGTAHPGIAVLDVSRILDPKAHAMTHWTRAEDKIGGALLALQYNEHPATFAKARGEALVGIILYAAVPLVAEGRRLGTAEFWWPTKDSVGRYPSAVIMFLDRFKLGACHPSVMLTCP